MENSLLENIIEESFKYFLKEERGINYLVSSKVLEVVQDIEGLLKDKHLSREYISEGIYRGNVETSTIFNDCKILLSINYTHFRDIEYFKKYKDKSILSSAVTMFSGKNRCYINVKCYGISGKLRDDELRDSLQHEFNHILQSINGSKSINNFNSKFLYNIAISNLQNEDNIIKRLSWMIYYSYDFEQDGFVNGLYGYYNNDEHQVPTWNEIREMEIYNAITALKNGIDWFESNSISDDEKYRIKKVFGKDKSYLLKFCQRGFKRFLKKFYGILRKIQDEKKNFTIDRGFLPLIW